MRWVTLAFAANLLAGQSVLVLHVTNPRGKPMSGVVLNGSPADRSGKTRIRLDTPDRWITLQVTSPPDLLILSPWDGAVKAPIANDRESFVPVTLGKRGDPIMLESGPAIAAMAARINAASGPAKADSRSVEERRAAALAEAAPYFGFEAGEMDRAIRAWQARSKDSYETGMSALYARDYAAAVLQLSAALLTRGKQLKKVASQVAEAAFFLGQALFEQGKFDKSAEAYRKALALRRDDPLIMNGLGLALLREGKPGLAEPFLAPRGPAAWR